MKSRLHAALFGLVLLASAGAGATLARAAITPEQKKEIEEIKKELGKVPGMVSKKEVDEAEKLLEDAEQKLKKIATDSGDANNRLIGGLLKQIEQRRTQLSRKSGGGADKGPAINFEKEVAPILVKSCLSCHDDGASGGLRFDTFAGIVAGCGGKLVVPGNPQASLLMQRVVANGDARMPKGGKPLAADEIKKLAAWIAGGAKFDGQNDIPLADIAAGKAPKTDNTPVAIATATGDEKVSFKRDIAPFMVNLCLGCHGANNPRAGFSLDTFEKLMRGGRSGRVVLPGNTEDSRLWHLVGKQDPIKMPQGQALITRTNHTNLRVWIEEGAKFDGPDPKAPIRSLVPTEAELRAEALAKMTPEEVLQQRADRAQELWKKASPQESPQLVETENLRLLGNVPAERLQKYADESEAALKQIGSVFKPSGWWRGKLTLFVFNDRFSYAEFVQTNEMRELLPEITSHARIRDPDDAYVCLQDLGDDATEQTPGLSGTVLSQLTEAYLQKSTVKLPEWVVRGTGLALAARSDVKNDYYRKLAASAGSRLSTLAQPADLLKDGTFSPADLGPVGYSVVAYMLKQGEPQYVQFLGQLQGGKSLDDALKGVYNADAGKVAVSYLAVNAGSARAATKKARK